MSGPSILQRILGSKAGTKMPSSVEIEAELKAERAAEAQASAALSSLQEQRRTPLLTGTDETRLDRLESEIAVAIRSRDRAAARSEALASALIQAINNERRASVQATYDAAVKQIADALEWQNTRYDAIAAELANGFRMLMAADDLVASNSVQIPEGAEPLVPPSHDRMRANFANQPKVYADVRKLQAVDPDAEPLWQFDRLMLPF